MELISIGDAAALLDTTTAEVHRMIDDGTLIAIRVRSSARVLLDDGLVCASRMVRRRRA